MDLYVGIVWMLKKSITKHICKYYNGCKKKSITIYETYMRVLQWM